MRLTETLLVMVAVTLSSLAVTLLLDRDLGLGYPVRLARGRRFVTDRHGPCSDEPRDTPLGGAV